MDLKWQDKGIKTPLARARGLGSAGEGTTHWLHQRITAISNFILILWLIFSVVSVHELSYPAFLAWLAHPLNAIAMILALVSVCYHATLGSQVIVEDYIHNEGFKFLKLIGIRLFFTALAVAGIFSVLKVALAG